MPLGCLSVALPALFFLFRLNGPTFWLVVFSATNFIALMSLGGKWVTRMEINRLEDRVEVGLVQETHIVSHRCFELSGDRDESEPARIFFGLGVAGTVMTALNNYTLDIFYRTFRMFPYLVASMEKDQAITDFRYSISQRYPNYDFVYNRFEIDGKFVCGWLRCRGQCLTPTNSIFYGSEEEREDPKYEPFVLIPKPFDECLREALEI